MTKESSRRYLTLPNALTVSRVVLLPVILWSILEKHFDWALGLWLAAGISDLLDGLLARWLNQRTLFGMFLDPIADKLLLSSTYIVLSVQREIPWWVTGLVLARDATIIVTVVVLVLNTALRKFPPSLLGKINTVVQLAAVYVVLLDAVYSGQWLDLLRRVIMILVPALVIASGLHYSYQMIRKLTRERRQAPEPPR